MNTAQIAQALERDPIMRKKFCGVFSSDRLPESIERCLCGFVVNTDPSKPTWNALGSVLLSYGT